MWPPSICVGAVGFSEFDMLDFFAMEVRSSSSARQKTRPQIEAIEEVQRAVEAAYDAVTAYLCTAVTPISEAAHVIIDEVLEAHGCQSPEGHIVAGGLESVEPHEKGSGTLPRGMSIVIDIYPRSKRTGLYADMTRAVCIGQPSVELQRMYDAVLSAQQLAISMVRPGVACRDIQIAVERYFLDSGYETSGKGKEFSFAEGFVHSIGHGVGTEIHEPPRFGKGSEDILIEGEVITIEPGLLQRNRRDTYRGYGARDRGWVSRPHKKQQGICIAVRLLHSSSYVTNRDDRILLSSSLSTDPRDPHCKFISTVYS